jgi:ketosteroid isomerase-like protein
VLALGHYLGRGLEAAFAHVIHVRDERIASLEWVTGTPSWPDPVPPETG